MIQTASSMIQLGTKAYPFSLIDVISGNIISFPPNNVIINAIVLMFICNHCPYVKHINKKLSEISLFYKNKNINFYAINSNDIKKYPEDSPENMKKIAIKNNYSFPYLYDETQKVAKIYKATCTPDFYIFNKKLLLVYRGQFDDSRPHNNIKVTGKSIKNAIENLINGIPIDTNQKPSIGCNIKWKI
ncbi:thioredoxin family protein [Candidatus Legionella polyplacis]|uniref:thioredoxin family protein n=1 Tax=Candidatus Legionella polyplacis TaxID=2005262 RepID=UPI000C1F5A37|nr:thioredoxin family protein [Candidatus Legionella polyplacis]ATW01646.1 thioredoxin family protein [Candidatus Legionella polyplacis]